MATDREESTGSTEGTVASSQGRPPTYGERAVGINFNPSGDSFVAGVKEAYAHIIDGLNEGRNETDDPEQKRHYSIAITDAETAQMRAVKAITWR